MMANLVTSSEKKGVIATKIAKVNGEVSNNSHVTQLLYYGNSHP